MISKNNIRLLLVSPVPPPAGGDSTWSRYYIDYSITHGYPIEHVDTSIIGNRTKTVSDSVNMFDEINRCFRIWKNIRRVLRVRETDIVHMNTNCSPRGLLRDYISSRIIRHYQVPYVVHCRCNVADQIKESILGSKCFENITKYACETFVQNKKSLVYVKAIRSCSVMVMPNFICEDKIASRKTVNERIKTVVFTGHVRKTKGIDEFLETAKHFPQYTFTVVGPITTDYSEEEILKDSVGNVKIIGAVEGNEVINYLDEADLFLFPTYTEGFSNSLLEAMARGLPVITTDVGANKDMIETMGGQIVPRGSADSIIEALNSLESREIRQKMSDWNIQKTRESYSMTKVITLMRKQYERLLNENNY